jgi:hypothetical protein
MEKVKVNKVVAGWIEKARSEHGNDPSVLWHILELQNVTRSTLTLNKIDLVTLAKAIQYGYEVEKTPREWLLELRNCISMGAGIQSKDTHWVFDMALKWIESQEK